MHRVILFVLIAAGGVAAFPPDAGSRGRHAVSSDAICWIEFAPGALRHYCRDEGQLLACESARADCRAIPAASVRA